MDWTCAFFLHKSQEWEHHIATSLANRRPGHECYASRQARLYRQLAEDAEVAFQPVKMRAGLALV
jgi:hypothetical protein